MIKTLIRAAAAVFALIAMILLALGLATIFGYWPTTLILGALFFAALAYTLWGARRR